MTASTAADHPPHQQGSAVPRATDREIAPRLEATLRRIAQFADLRPDWDSYGGDPPSPRARTEAGQWVEIVADLFGARAGDAAVPYSVAPLADGGVQLEWRGRSGVVELEVGPEGELGYLFLAGAEGGAPAEEGDDASWSDVLRALSRVFTEDTDDTEAVVLGPAHKEYSVMVRINRERGEPLVEI
jgi:hypothetical protein